MLHQYTLQELSHTLWALAIFEHHPGAPQLPPVKPACSQGWTMPQS
jgi:hypothetical protein